MSYISYIWFLLCPLISNLENNKNTNQSQSSEYASAVEYVKNDFDVISVNSSITFTDIQNKSIIGSSTFTVSTENPSLEIFYFHLENLSIVDLRGNEIYQSAKGIVDGSKIFILINPKIENNQFQFSFTYSGNMGSEGGSYDWGGVFYRNEMLYAMGVGFHYKPVSTTRFWMPCFDHPSDKFTANIELVVPDTLTAITNGMLVGQDNVNGYNYFRYSNDTPITSYLYNFAVGKYKKYEVNNSYGNAYIYGFSEDSSAINKIFVNAPEMVYSFEEKFGAYPSDKNGFVITDHGAMEHFGLISYPHNLLAQYSNSNNTMNEIAAHELGHQWFGNYVSPLDFRSAWLSESFATYSELVWVKHKLGIKNYFSSAKNKASKYLFNIVNNEGVVALHDFERKRPSSNYPETIYQKGAIVLEMLRFKLGDEVFFGLLKEWLNVYGGNSASTEQFQALANNYTKQNLDTFFNEWIYGKGYPEITINATNLDNNKLLINIKQIQPEELGTYSNVAMDLLLENTDNTFDTLTVEFNKETNLEIDREKIVRNIYPNYGINVVSLIKINSVFTSIENERDENNKINFNFSQLTDEMSIESYNTVDEIIVSDITGNVVYNVFPNSNNIQADLSNLNLPIGVYFILIKNNGQFINDKFSIVR